MRIRTLKGTKKNRDVKVITKYILYPNHISYYIYIIRIAEYA